MQKIILRNNLEEDYCKLLEVISPNILEAITSPLLPITHIRDNKITTEMDTQKSTYYKLNPQVKHLLNQNKIPINFINRKLFKKALMTTAYCVGAGARKQSFKEYL